MQLCGSLNILWHCLSLGLEWKLTFSSPVATAEFFQICWPIEYNTFTASSLRMRNSSTGIPSPPLALFIMMLPKAHLTSHSRMSGSRWVITPSWLSGSWRSSLYSSVYFWNSHKDHHSSPKSRGRDTSDTHCWDQGPETLCCSAYTWTNVSSSDKIQTIRD